MNAIAYRRSQDFNGDFPVEKELQKIDELVVHKLQLVSNFGEKKKEQLK